MLFRQKICVVILSLAFLAAAPAESPRPSVQTQKCVLPNGLTVLITEMAASPVVTVDMMVKAGSADEGEFLGSGVTHFLEHMLFKGTAKRAVGQIAQEVQSIGGIINASTGKDHTFFTITVPAEDFKKSLEIMADMMQHPRLDAQEIEKEKEVVISEMRLHRDRPEYYLSDLVFQNAYLAHPYGVPIIGFEDLLKRLTREDFVRYYRLHYVPNNMVLSVSGNISYPQGVAAIEEYFSAFPRGFEVVGNRPVEPPRLSPHRYEEEYPTELARMSISFPGVSLRDPDMYALDALAMILGQGEESRLHVTLFKKKPLVRGIFASNFTPLDAGIFEVEVTLDQENIEPVIVGVKEQIASVQRQGVSYKELARVKAKMLSEYVQNLQTSADVSYEAAFGETALGDPNFSERYLEAVDQLNPEDIRRVAQKYLRRDRISIVILKPKTKASAAIVPAVPATPEPKIESITLTNGLRILVREDHRLPLVSMNLALYGGTRVESNELIGLSFLTAQLWGKGTGHRTPARLTQELEEHGMSLSMFSGDSSWGIHLDLLSKDVDFAVDLLEELIKSPRFDNKEFLDIKRNMQTGIQERADSISKATSLRLKEILFPRHPFRRDALGNLESVARITLADAQRFYEEWVAPNNMVLTVFGDVNKDRVIAAFESRFANLKKKAVAVPKFPREAMTPQTEDVIRLDKKQAMVMIGVPAPHMFDPDRYAMEVLNTILTSPFRGRIFNTIREQFGQSYTLGGDFVPLLDDGLLYFYVLTSPDNAAAVKEVLWKIIRVTATQGVTLTEMNDAKEFLKGTSLMGLQTNSQIANRCMTDELYGLGCTDYQNFNASVDAVTQADVERLAKKYLDLSRSVFVLANPLSASTPRIKGQE